MSAVRLPRTPLIDTAIELGRHWCAGEIIDGSPAIGHALKVARKVVEHVPDASEDLVAAVILHDSPFFAPNEIDLDAVLTERLSPQVARIVRAIEREHDALDNQLSPWVEIGQLDVMIASAADKVVSIAAILRRARRFADPAVFWVSRQAFVDRVSYFQAFARAALPVLPSALALELDLVLAAAIDATSAYRRDE